MNNRGLIRYVFASSHTSQGFCTFIPELIQGLERVYILKGAPGTGKSTFIRMIGEIMAELGFETEFWISAFDAVTPDGVYLPQLNRAVINGSLPESIDPRYPGVREILINLGDFCDAAELETYRQEIVVLVDEILSSREQVYKALKEAGRVKAEIRRLNAQFIDMEKLGQLTRQMSSEILENQPGEKHYFAGVLTSEGFVDYVHNLSQACQQRYIFTGPAGSGKSMVISEVARQAREQGYFLEYYHCGLEADSLAMVIIRNLQIALIEAREAEIPACPWDRVVDLGCCMEEAGNGKMKEGKSMQQRNLESLLLAAQQQLEKSAQHNKALKKIYASTMDFTRLDQLRKDILEELRK